MRGILPWAIILIVFVAAFVYAGGLRSRTALIVLGAALVAGIVAAFFLLKHR